LYLYEVVDIIGQGQYDYMEHLWKDPVIDMPAMNSLQGSFYICAQGGGRWPQVINIWDIGAEGWQSWASNVDRLNLKRRKAYYGDWWDEALKWRTGGFDRVCAGVPGSPSTSDIRDRGIHGTLFINEILTVRPGTQLEFLDQVVNQRVELMHDYGAEATGLYEVMSNQHEVVMTWATSIAALTQFRQNRDTTHALSDEGSVDERIRHWEQTSAGYVTGGDTHVMTPLPGTVYGPPDWEDASLDQWLNPYV